MTRGTGDAPRTATPGEVARISKKTGRPVRACVPLTAKRQNAVLEQIAATCNVRFAARVVGVSAGAIYALKNRDAGFAERFAAAVQAGYERVEAELLAHALAGGAELADADEQCGDDGGSARPLVRPAFDPNLALKVLALRNEGRRAQPRRDGPPLKRATEREIEDELVLKLKGLAKRLALIA